MSTVVIDRRSLPEWRDRRDGIKFPLKGSHVHRNAGRRSTDK